MKEIVYSFYNTLGDKFYLRLLCEGDMYLSQEIVSYLKEKDFELWGIYLDRLGNAQKVTPMKLLNKISQTIASFFIDHPNAILFYQCDDISDVPMSIKKVDTPIYIAACGNDIYIHIISREIHIDVVDKIKKDIHFGFDK